MVKFVARTQGRAVSTSVRGRKMGTVKYRKRTNRKQLVNRTSVPVGLGFPKRMVMTHKYCDSLTLTSTLGAIGKHLFNCNGMWDPNSTGGGHQPLFFDQMTPLYNHYTVIGSRMKIRVTPKATNEEAFYIGTWLDDDTVTSNITTFQDIAERSSGKVVLVPANSNNVYRFGNSWSAKKTFGGSILGNDNLQGSISANPAESTYFGLGIQTASTATVDAEVLVEITYIAVWDELKDVLAS